MPSSIMTVKIMSLSIMTLSMMTISIMTLSIMTLSIITLSITVYISTIAEHCNSVLLHLLVVIKLCAVMLNVMAPFSYSRH